MIGGLLKSTSSLAVLAAAGILVGGMAFAPTAARAADLGGDCCADLEERVAELEATTVKHGNRKVSLKISGWVNMALMYWNDNGGTDPNVGDLDENSDVFIGDNSYANSRFTLSGEGKVNSDVTMGFSMQLRPRGTTTGGVDQIDHNPSPNAIVIRSTYVYLNSKSLGKLQLGKQDSAADGAWYQDLGGSNWVSGFGPANHGGSFILRDTAGHLTSLRWASLIADASDSQEERIAYYSPTLGGFQLAASWGGDDTSAIALYYAGTFQTVSVAAGIGYDVSNRWDADSIGGDQADQGAGSTPLALAGGEWRKLAASASIYESGSGLFATGTYQINYSDITGRNDATGWFAKLGWRKNVTGMGETGIYGLYNREDDLYRNDVSAHQWGAGIFQDLDSVGSTLYLDYRHSTLDTDGVGALSSPGGTNTVDGQSFDVLTAGAVVQF